MQHNTSLLTIQPLETAANLRNIYWFQRTYECEKLDKNQFHGQ